MKAPATNSTSIVPDYLYRIAIDGLPVETECLREGGIYLINVDEWDDCTLLTKQLLNRVPSNKRGVLVSTTTASNSIERLQQALSDEDPGTLRLIDGSLTSLKALPTTLHDAVRPHQRTILLLLPSNVVSQLSQPQFRTLLSRWQPWLSSVECALLILSVSNESALGHADMLYNNDLLSGLAHLERTSATEFTYRCTYWRSAMGVTSAKSLHLSQRSGTLRVHSLDTSASFSFASRRRLNNVVIIEESALKDFGYVKENHWIVEKTRAAVYEHARKNVDITVIFALSHYKQLPEIARFLHALRLERGPVIRLIVREMSTQLRIQDEQKLLDCGANLILGGSISYTRFKSLLENIQTIRYVRRLSTTYDTSFETSQAPEPEQAHQGLVDVNTFLQRCRQKLYDTDHRPAGEATGVLIDLQPVPGLSAQQLLTQVVLRRHEDVITHFDNKIYLFLYGCPPELVATVLHQLFRLPVEEIFINQTIYEDLPSIQGALERMQTSYELLDSTELPPTETPVTAAVQTRPGAHGALRYTPKRVSLMLS